MSRISIDVTPEEHQKLKALAALQGMSIKKFVLERTLGEYNGQASEQALATLEDLLNERVRKAESGSRSTRTVGEIFDEAYREESSGEVNG